MTLLVLLLPFARAYLCELLGLVCVPFCLVLSAGACSFRFGLGSPLFLFMDPRRRFPSDSLVDSPAPPI